MLTIKFIDMMIPTLENGLLALHSISNGRWSILLPKEDHAS